MINTNQNLLFIATVLALCVISFVHIFLFPLYGISPKPSVSRTIADFEQSLCSANLKYKKTWRRHRCPQDGIVTVQQGGRLGNQLWEYASVWALARRTGLEPYVPRCIRQRLDQVFETLTIPTLDEIAHCSVNLNTFVNSLEMWNYTNQSIVLPRYAVLPEVVLTWVHDIFQEFTFRKKLRDKCFHVLRSACKLINASTCLFVGVHVRRTDYLGYLWRKHRTVLADPRYFYSAMEYFERKYQSVVFVVISDDPVWCLQHLTRKKNVYVASKRTLSSPGQDLAIMSSCNHSIIDYGTFGVWGAILAGGETILYNVSHHSAQRVAELLPDWHILS